MLSINSTLKEIELAHREKNIKQLAKEIGIGERKLKQLLATAGYEYDTAIKKWRYVLLDEENDNRERSLYSIEVYGINKGNTDITSVEENKSESSKVIESNISMTNISEMGNDITNFTLEEISALKQLAQQQMEKGVSNDTETILEAIKCVPYGSTSKKTFVIDDEMIKQLDSFCEQWRVKKSDFLAVAIQDALKKYW